MAPQLSPSAAAPAIAQRSKAIKTTMHPAVFATFVSALGVLSISAWFGWLDEGVSGWVRSFAPWLLVLGFVVHGSWFRAVHPYRGYVRLFRFWYASYRVMSVAWALTLTFATGLWLQSVVDRYTVATPLEGIAVPASVLGGLAAGVLLYVLLHVASGNLQRLRLRGKVSAAAVEEIVVLAGAWIPVLLLFVALSEWIGNTTIHDLGVFFGIAAAATLGYALPRLGLRPSRTTAVENLWIIVPRTVKLDNWLRWVDRIASAHRNQPVTLVSPPDAVAYSEHLDLAERLGMLETLFPRLNIQVRDWQRSLPPAEQWSSLPHRQIHPLPELMPQVVNNYFGIADQAILLADREDDLEDWRGQLPIERTRVFRLVQDGSTIRFESDAQVDVETVAGYLIGSVTPRLQKSIMTLLTAFIAILLSLGGVYFTYQQAGDLLVDNNRLAQSDEPQLVDNSQLVQSDEPQNEIESIPSENSDNQPITVIEPEMVRILPGKFLMGSPEVEKDPWYRGDPQREVTIAYAFEISKYEITFDEYDAFIKETSERKLPSDQGWGRGKRPVINVSWRDTQDYVKWLSDKTGKRYRLPSDAEWEYAARANTQTRYWWGNDIGKNNANCAGCGSQWDDKQSAPVGSFKANAFGLYDTSGNVWEWIQDCWHENYANAPTDGSAWLGKNDEICNYRVVRGGSWNNQPENIQSDLHIRTFPDVEDYRIGFRIARDL